MKDQDIEYPAADFGARLEAEKAALVAEDELRIRMTALDAAAEVSRGTLKPTGKYSDEAGDNVLRIAERFARWLKTGDIGNVAHLREMTDREREEMKRSDRPIV